MFALLCFALLCFASLRIASHRFASLLLLTRKSPASPRIEHLLARDRVDFRKGLQRLVVQRVPGDAHVDESRRLAEKSGVDLSRSSIQGRSGGESSGVQKQGGRRRRRRRRRASLQASLPHLWKLCDAASHFARFLEAGLAVSPVDADRKLPQCIARLRLKVDVAKVVQRRHGAKVVEGVEPEDATHSGGGVDMHVSKHEQPAFAFLLYRVNHDLLLRAVAI